MIGAFEGGFYVRFVWPHLSHADADGASVVSKAWKMQGSNSIAQALGNNKGIGEVCSGQCCNEFLTAIAAKPIRFAQCFLGGFGNRLNDCVSHKMAKLVVHLFEAIDVDHEDGNRGLVAPHSVDLACHAIIPGTPTEYASQSIARSNLTHFNIIAYQARKFFEYSNIRWGKVSGNCVNRPQLSYNGAIFGLDFSFGTAAKRRAIGVLGAERNAAHGPRGALIGFEPLPVLLEQRYGADRDIEHLANQFDDRIKRIFLH